MPSPKYRFYVSVAYGGSTVEVFPTNFNKTKIVPTQEREQIFFRKKFSGKLIFINDTKTSVTDFDKFFSVELGTSIDFPGASRCTYFLLTIKKLCNGVYVEYWTGRFSTGAGKFNLDQCTFEITPDVYDKYTCFFDMWETEIDIIQPEFPLSYYETTPAQGTIRTLTSRTVHDECGIIPDSQVCKIDNVVTACGTIVFGEWCYVRTDIFDTECAPGTGNILHIHTDVFTREEITTNCVSGVPNPPDPSWTLVTGGDRCGVDNEADFYRCNTGAFAYGRLRKVNDLIEAILGESDCDLEYTSIFFNHSPDTLDAFYLLTNGGVDNYVTGAFSWTNHLMIAQKSDIKRPTASNPAQHGILSLKKLLLYLQNMFAGNVHWDITDSGFLQVEHSVYWGNNVSTIDFRTRDIERNIKKNVFEHTRLEIPRKETFSFMEGEHLSSGDFANNSVLYSEACSTPENEVTVPVDEVTTNLEFITDWPDEIAEDGFVIIATSTDGTDYFVNFEIGLLSGAYRANGHLSWANLLYNYGRYDRFLPEGQMNGNAETFFTYKPTIKQVPLVISLCCDDDFEPMDQFNTELGDLLGSVPARVDTAEINNGTDILTVVFKYPF